MNKDLKSEAGVIGLTEDQNAMKKWMLAGPKHAWQLWFFAEEYLKLVIDDDELSEYHEYAESHHKGCDSPFDS